MAAAAPAGRRLEATRRTPGDQRTVGTRVVVLTTFELDDYVFEALRAGASGFLLKETEPEELRSAILWFTPARHCCRRV